MSDRDYLWAPPSFRSLPVAGGSRYFPVGRIFCVGRNYHAHAVEMGRPVDKASARPFYFLKDASSLVESGGTVPYPAGTQNYHYEVELVVAIGADGFRLAQADAERMIFGYSVGLDMTRRDLQFAARDQGRPWDLGKNFENAAISTAIMPKGDLGVISGGKIELQVNGKTRQSADLGQMIWTIPELLADLSHFYHLRAGDLIFTGTPEGVGPVLPGDHIAGAVERVGTVELTIGAPE